MKVAYVAGPYRDARGPYYIAKNIEAARDVAVELWRMGYAVICPHANTAMMDGAADDAVWLEGDLELQLRCDVTVMLPGWESSRGATAEHEAAHSLGGHRVFYWPDEREQIAAYADTAASAREWVGSPEGRLAMAESLQRAEQTIAGLTGSRRLESAELHRPMTF